MDTTFEQISFISEQQKKDEKYTSLRLRERLLNERSLETFNDIEILSTIAMSLTDLYRARLAMSSGRGVAACAADFKYPRNREFAVKNAFNECQNIPEDRIRRTVSVFAALDFRLKTRSGGKGSDMLLLEEACAKAMTLRQKA